ncbi:MAG: HAD-IIIA family hydrolase [Bacteroidota bacterium]|nr:HAD-IIIA family hydrolase [Bacteroidota bacterium]|tara:strand:- start:3738 stop:4265 length:528 start_codon:yes stop_codon:yes gene_type:complete
MYKKKAIFFDRDGVVNKLVARDGGLYSPRVLKDFIFYDDIKPCIDYLIEKNFLIFIISNQPDISRGKMTIKELEKIDLVINKKLRIDEIYYSFESEFTINGTKKPSPKMLFEAREKWKIDFSKSFFVGDSIADRDCAKNANLSFILVSRSHNKELNYSVKINTLNDLKNIIEKRV